MRKERPILFSGPMVRAILDGKKTMTRRLLKPQPVLESSWRWKPRKLFDVNVDHVNPSMCPHGSPGDVLWVRENFQTCECVDCIGIWYPATNEMRVLEYDPTTDDYTRITQKLSRDFADESIPMRPSIHMPRWASRLSLQIQSVRVERLQDASLDDIRAEGIQSTIDYGPILVEMWKELWNELNAKRGYPWESNPLVWVVEFKVLSGHNRPK